MNTYRVRQSRSSFLDKFAVGVFEHALCELCGTGTVRTGMELGQLLTCAYCLEILLAR